MIFLKNDQDNIKGNLMNSKILTKVALFARTLTRIVTLFTSRASSVTNTGTAIGKSIVTDCTFATVFAPEVWFALTLPARVTTAVYVGANVAHTRLGTVGSVVTDGTHTVPTGY